jgi:hypothetical protein
MTDASTSNATAGGDPALVYLDQLHIGNMDTEQLDRLVELAEAGRIVVPSSDIHTVETLKQGTRHRPETIARLRALRARWVLLPEPTVLAAEWLAFRGRIVRARDCIVGEGQPVGVVWDGAVADSVEMAGEHVDDDGASELRASSHETFADAAARLEEHKRVPLDHVRGQLTELMRMSIDPEIALAQIPETEAGFAEAFPSAGLRRFFYAHANSLEANDIADLSFICRTVPHFDVVAVDRRMHDRLYATRGKLDDRVAEVLFRATVVKTTERAMDAIERLLG